jgi:membrane associated rhomboid family serine protease
MNEPLAFGSFVLIALTAWGSFQGFRNPAFRDRFIFSPAPILREREYHRLVTSAFLHADWTHFLFNAFSLYSFGRYLELFFGLGTLLAIYFGSIVGGSLLSLYLHRHHDYRALGASGGVCGVIFASIFLLPGGGIYVFPIPVAVPSWLYAIVFLLASFYGVRRQLGHVGHDAHLGGAIIGLWITTALYPGIVRESPLLYATVMVLATGMFLYLWLNPLFLPPRAALQRVREFVSQTARRVQEAKRGAEHREMDRLLDKVSRSGLQSLSALERKRLESLARRRKTDNGGAG